MACQKCGRCCSWGTGYVFVSNKKYDKYTKFKDYPLEDLVFMKAVAVEGPCPYLNKNNLCNIYEDRPLFCKVGRCLKSLILPSSLNKKSSSSLEVRIEAKA